MDQQRAREEHNREPAALGELRGQSRLAPVDHTLESRPKALGSRERTLRVTGPERTPDPSLLERARENRVCRWAISYMAVAWMVLQLLDVLDNIWDLSVPFLRLVSVLLGLTFFPVVVLAWYHGERGRQPVSAPEAAILALLVIGSTLVVWGI